MPVEQNLIRNGDLTYMQGTLPESWDRWSPRPELAPGFAVEPMGVAKGKASLSVHGYDNGQIGFWKQRCEGVEAGQWYLFSVHCQISKIALPIESLWIKLEWQDALKNPIEKCIVSGLRRKGEDILVEDSVFAPKDAVSVVLELGLKHCTGTVRFSEPSLKRVASKLARSVRVSTVCYIPPEGTTPEKNLAFYAEKIDQAGQNHSDIVCLGETINSAFTGRTPFDVAESLPGPSTDVLGRAAKRNRIWVVTSLNEREGNRVYNTAVLIDREGKIVGKYRKTHLPETEILSGVTPGFEYPVFQTDFGVVGMQVCYDNFFPEVARSLVLNGAEILFTPIWGDARNGGVSWDIMARARAIDNAVPFVASSFTPTRRSLIIDASGRILGDTKGQEGLVTAELKLGERQIEPWLSVSSSAEWRRLYRTERRSETYGSLSRKPL